MVLGFADPGWLLFAVLIVLLGMRHPPPLNDISPLDTKRYIVGGVALAVLVSGFVAVPITAPNGMFAVGGGPTQFHPGGTGMADNTTVSVTNHDLVAHGYVIEGKIDSVTAAVNGTAVTLQGAALAAFLANSTWSISLPNHNTSAFSRTANFSVPTSDYSQVDAGDSATFSVAYSNSQQAQVAATLTVVELCPSSASATSSVAVSFQ